MIYAFISILISSNQKIRGVYSLRKMILFPTSPFPKCDDENRCDKDNVITMYFHVLH